MEQDNKWRNIGLDGLPKSDFEKVKWICKDGVTDVGFWFKGEFRTMDIRSREEVIFWKPLLTTEDK